METLFCSSLLNIKACKALCFSEIYIPEDTDERYATNISFSLYFYFSICFNHLPFILNILNTQFFFIFFYIIFYFTNVLTPNLFNPPNTITLFIEAW